MEILTPLHTRGTKVPKSSANSGVESSSHQSTPLFVGLGGVGFRRSIRAEPTPAAPQERISHKFQPSTCPQCNQVSLYGMVAEGHLVHLDPTPLDATTEVSALLDGRVTWHMTRDLEVCWRTGSKITYRPAGNHTDYAVFAEHRCHQPIPASISSWAWGPHAPAITPEEPQF